MAPHTWDELAVDGEMRYREVLEADRRTGRSWADGYAATVQIISQVRDHFAFQEVMPLISHGTLVFRTARKNGLIYDFCERFDLPCKVSLHDWETSTTDSVMVNLAALIPTLRNYLEKLRESPNDEG